MKTWVGYSTFVVGLLLGNEITGFIEKYDPGYIDRDQAFAKGLKITRQHCAAAQQSRLVNCKGFALKSSAETRDGWHFVFLSGDGKREDSMRIGRRGEYRSFGERWVDGKSREVSSIGPTRERSA